MSQYTNGRKKIILQLPAELVPSDLEAPKLDFNQQLLLEKIVYLMSNKIEIVNVDLHDLTINLIKEYEEKTGRPVSYYASALPTEQFSFFGQLIFQLKETFQNHLTSDEDKEYVENFSRTILQNFTSMFYSAR